MEKRQINIRGSHIHLQMNIINKDQPTIIFLHDSFGCIQLWRDFPALLAASTHMNFIVYDRHGYGQSGPFLFEKRPKNYLHIEAEILSEIIDYLKIKDIILFGHSDGATIALLTAANYPQNIKAIITEGAHIFVEEITKQGIREVVSQFISSGLSQRLQKYHGKHTEKLFYAWHNTWLDEQYSDWNIEKELEKIHCPTLVIQGTEDEYGTEKQMDGIIKAVKGPVQKSLMNQIGHNPHKEDPSQTISICQNFITQHIVNHTLETNIN